MVLTFCCCVCSLKQGRWLHLFQLVEKQYQEQILAQQEQYQCQIQVCLCFNILLCLRTPSVYHFVSN